MYYKSSHYEKKSVIKYTYSFIFKLCISLFFIILIQYFFSQNEDKIYYFQFEKINRIYYNQKAIKTVSHQKNIFTLQQNDFLYALSSTLPIIASDSNPYDEIFLEKNIVLQANSNRTLLSLSTDGLVSSVAQSQKYGVALGYSDGNIKIIFPMKTKEQETLLYQSIDIEKPILMIAWEKEDIIVFVLEDAQDILQKKKRERKHSLQNSTAIYRFSKANTKFQLKSVLADKLYIENITKIYSVEGIGIYTDTVQDIELLYKDKIKKIFYEANLQFAGGTKDFHVLQFQKVGKQYLSMFIGANTYFSLAEKYFDITKNNKIHIHYYQDNNQFILQSRNDFFNDYLMVLKHE